MKLIRVSIDEHVEIHLSNNWVKLNPQEWISTSMKSQLYFTNLTQWGMYLVWWCLSHQVKITNVTIYNGVFFAIYLDKIVIKCYQALGYEKSDEAVDEIYAHLQCVNQLCNEQLDLDLYSYKINSLASIGMQFLQKKAPQIFITLATDMEEFIQQGFVGGRCELIRQGVFEDVVYFDFPSMYGNLLCEDFPQFFSWNPLQLGVQSTALPQGFIEAVVEIFPQKPYLAPLPKRHEQHGVIYPIGQFHGVFWSEELNLINEYKLGQIKQVGQILYASPGAISCKNVAVHLLQLRRGGNTLAKRILNSIYGRLAMTPSFIKTEFFLSQDFVLADLTQVERVSFWRNLVMLQRRRTAATGVKNNKAAAAIITSRARCKLYRLLMGVADEGEFLYVDTDAVYLQPRNLSAFLLKNPEWKHLNRVEFFNERAYTITNFQGAVEHYGALSNYRGSFNRVNLKGGCTRPHTISEPTK